MNSIKEWKSKVKEYNSDLCKKLENESTKKELYYGFEVFDGKIIENPEILYIGINPGKGNEIKNINIFETERISYLDFFDEDYRYHLAEKTIKFLRAIWSDERIKKTLSENTMKTNFYHLATENVSDLNSVLSDIKYNKEYFNKSAEFSISLIEILKPTLVILEGKSVFDYIVGECYQKKVWNSEHKYGHYFDKKNNTHILGYSRERGYSAEHYNHFSLKIKEILG